MKNLLIFLFIGIALPAFSQKSTLDIPGMHQLIDESKSEHTKQVKARNQQTENTLNEEANLSLLKKMKDMYRTLQQRYNTLGTVINIAEIGIYATPMVKHIISYQAQIVKLVEKNPAISILGYQTEIEFVKKADALSGYVAGLTLSFGDVNQMKASDRKLLFDYVLSELSSIQNLSGNMLGLLQYANMSSVLRALNPFQSYVDQDQSMIRDILNNAKFLKQ